MATPRNSKKRQQRYAGPNLGGPEANVQQGWHTRHWPHWHNLGMIPGTLVYACIIKTSSLKVREPANERPAKREATNNKNKIHIQTSEKLRTRENISHAKKTSCKVETLVPFAVPGRLAHSTCRQPENAQPRELWWQCAHVFALLWFSATSQPAAIPIYSICIHW